MKNNQDEYGNNERNDREASDGYNQGTREDWRNSKRSRGVDAQSTRRESENVLTRRVYPERVSRYSDDVEYVNQVNDALEQSLTEKGIGHTAQRVLKADDKHSTMQRNLVGSTLRQLQRK